MLLMDVLKAFEPACRKACEKDKELLPHLEELMRLGLAHERRPLCIENLCNQVIRYENGFVGRRRGPKLGPEKLAADRQRIIESVAHMYMRAIKIKRDQDNMSESQRLALSHKKSLHNDVAQLIREVPRNGFET